MGVTLEPGNNNQNTGNMAGQLMAGAAPIIGGLMGMATAGWEDRRQLRQQEKLQNLRLKGEKEMMGLQQQYAKDFWEETNYAAQVEQMKKAGLSPGLMYGKGGAGGQLMKPSGGLGGANAVQGNSIMQGMDLATRAAQLSLLKSQKGLIDSEARKNTVTADKTEGIDTEEAKSRIAVNTEEIENKRALRRLNNAQADFVDTQDDIAKSKWGLERQVLTNDIQRGLAEVRSAYAMADIDEASKDDRILSYALQAQGLILENTFKRAGIEKTAAEIDKINSDIAATWENLELEGKKVELTGKGLELDGRRVTAQEEKLILDKFEAKIRANYQPVWNMAGGWFNELSEDFDALIRKLGVNAGPIYRHIPE